MGTPENEIGTEEEAKAYRAEYAAELAAEESGSPIVDTSIEAEPIIAEPVIEKDPDPVATDPFAGVDPAIKVMFDDLSSKVMGISATLEPRLKQTESRIGAITNKFNAANKVAEVEAAEKAAAPTKEQIEAAAKSDEEWEELSKDFPDWATAFDGRFDKKLAELKKQLSPGVDREALEAETMKLRTEMKDESEKSIQKAILTFAHPDWTKVMASKKFTEWLPNQSDEIKSRFNGSLNTTDLATDASFVLNAFKGEAPEPARTAAEIAAERAARLSNSRLPAGKKANAPKSEADMSPAELRAKIGLEVQAE